MKGFATYDIPVSPHVRKYLVNKFGEDYEVSQLDLLGMIIILMLSKKFKVNKKPAKITDSHKSEVYRISISYEYFEKQGFYLELEQLRLIGRACEKYFREMLFGHVLVNSLDQPKHRMKSIVQFCEAHNISIEDVDPMTLYRGFYRQNEAGKVNKTTNVGAGQSAKELVS